MAANIFITPLRVRSASNSKAQLPNPFHRIALWTLLLKSLSIEGHRTAPHRWKYVQVMAWCRQAARPYMDRCWSRYLSPYGATRDNEFVRIQFSEYPAGCHSCVIFICKILQSWSRILLKAPVRHHIFGWYLPQSNDNKRLELHYKYFRLPPGLQLKQEWCVY